MTPTHRGEEIEGRSYKEYAYCPVPASCSSTAYDSATLTKDSVERAYAGTKECRTTFNEIPGILQEKCCVPATNEMVEKGSTLPQYIAAAAANLCVVTGGAMLGWMSPIEEKLGSVTSDNPLGRKITADEDSWIGSLVAAGAVFGSFAAGYCAERWGRKRSLLLSTVPFLLGWILVATAGHVEQLYAARFIFGIALAYPFTIVPMYVGEIAETSVRGALGSFLQLFITIGLLYSYAIGPFVSYTVFWILCACVPVVFFLCFMVMPESPYYLLVKGEREEAVAALVKLRSKTHSAVQKEADEMQAAVEEAFRSQASVADLFKVKANFKALLFTCALAAFQQLTGVNIVLFYMQDIFQAAGMDKIILPSICTIIVGIVQTMASVLTPFVVDRLGRRLLLIISGVGETLTLGALGLFFYLQNSAMDVSSISWLPVVSLAIFISVYSIGWGPLPWAVMGEMFASNIKSKASGITVCVCWSLAFIVTKFAKVLPRFVLFWLFAAFCILSILFTVFILPETKGKSLQEIQDELNGVKHELPVFDGTSDGSKK